jgi:rhodanese-related sulfurtransferase
MDYEISVGEARLKLQSGQDVVLLDVREYWERELARIEPSLHIPMGEVPEHLQELDPDMNIIVYCHLGVRSLNVTAWLRQQGFEQVQSMRGGIDEWSKAIDTLVKRY